MPDKYGFNHLAQNGRPYVLCIEKDCNAGGWLPTWTEEMSKIHFLTHVYEGTVNPPTKNNESRVRICRICGNEFEEEKRRGRPRVKCYTCKPIKEED